MNTTPDASAAAAWLLVMLTGAVAGAVGQLIRTIAGMGNANRASATGQTVDPFSASRLVVSLLVGAAAGTIAAMSMSTQLTGPHVEASTILGLMAAGYAGSDFIEGVAGKFFPPSTTAPPPTVTTTTLTTLQVKPVNTLEADGSNDGAVG